ncbi:pyruvate dehydrogenase complex dihydrolipoamide acetyltransferase [Roseivirga sp. BDSF3-8]|uniref:pyruvate dehydrogenase complex dihydrolipoamide acetyltransferase n=1 Tax=Roseivirga sp. BDSF3-8 TaxID=3241598 RepID=UPI003531ED82
MAELIRMPKMSDTMEEGVIASWLVKEGDEVSSGDILAEVETDKATMELESYEDGVLLYIGVKEKEAVPVNGIIAIIGEEGEDISDLLEEAKSGGSDDEDSDSKKEEDDDKAEASDDSDEDDGDDEDIDVSDIDATVIRMPKMSDTMEEGVIAAWHKKVGDEVSSGDILAEVETDKATMELESYDDGTLLHIGVEEGDSVPVNGIIAVIGEEGADYEKILKAEKSGGKEKKEKKEEKPKAESKSDGKPAKEEKGDGAAKAPTRASGDTSSSDKDGRIKASPLAKKIAEEKGYDISKIEGSGDGGRIVKRDVENYTPQPEKAPEAKGGEAKKEREETGFSMPAVVGEERTTEQPVSQMRKTIARRLAESKFSAPHFYLTMEINMDRCMEARKSLNEVSPVKISFNDLVIKAAAAALRQHPNINVSWTGDTIKQHEHIHIGVAVAVDEGLLVPVVRFADNKSLAHIASEVKDLAGKAKNKKLQPKDWEGNTFSISNLGMFGIEEFTAIINPPDACIMAVGGIKQTAVVKDGQLVPGNVMKVTLSCDHRAVDGAQGAAFLQTFKQLLEDPIRIMI